MGAQLGNTESEENRPMVHPSLDTSGFASKNSGTAIQAYLERNRAHSLAAEAGYRAAASELRSLIRESGGRFAINASLQSRRVTRPLVQAADLSLDQARMFSLCLDLFRGAFPPVDGSTGGRRQFTPHA